MENKKIFCEIHNGILEDPYQCYFCKRYCCKDCIENYNGKICPFCQNEKKFNSDIRLKSELRTNYKKCEKCEKYFDHLNIKNHKDKCEKKIIHCYFCNFVGEKEKFIEHFYKKHKKILINDFEKIINFYKTNEKNYNFNDFEKENEDLYDCYIKQKSSDYINENMIQTERNNLIRNKNTFENKFIINNNYVYDKQNNPSSTRNKQSPNFIFETPINNKNNNNNNNYYNNNNNNYYNNNNNNNYYNNNNNNNYYNNNNNNNYNNNNNNNKNNNHIYNNNNNEYNNNNNNKTKNNMNKIKENNNDIIDMSKKVNNKNYTNLMICEDDGFFYCNKPKDFKCKCCEDNICKKGNCMCGNCQKENCKEKNIQKGSLINKYGNISIFHLGNFVCNTERDGKYCDGINYVCPGCQSLLENRIHYLDKNIYDPIQLIIDYNLKSN